MPKFSPNSDKGTRKEALPLLLSATLPDISGRVRAAMAEDLRECEVPRCQIAEELTKLAGRRITVAQIDALVSESHHNHRMPLELVPAWVYVTGSTRLLDLVVESAGLSLATSEDMQYAEYGRVSLRREKLAASLWERA